MVVYPWPLQPMQGLADAGRSPVQRDIPPPFPPSLDGLWHPCEVRIGHCPARLPFQETRFLVETIQCRRCERDAPKLERAPFRNPLGERIHKEICKDCWAEWLQHQTLLINHYGLDPREARAREFLYQQIEKVLLEGGEGEGVDTSQQGKIQY